MWLETARAEGGGSGEVRRVRGGDGQRRVCSSAFMRCLAPRFPPEGGTTNNRPVVFPVCFFRPIRMSTGNFGTQLTRQLQQAASGCYNASHCRAKSATTGRASLFPGCVYLTVGVLRPITGSGSPIGNCTTTEWLVRHSRRRVSGVSLRSESVVPEEHCSTSRRSYRRLLEHHLPSHGRDLSQDGGVPLAVRF